MDLRDEIIAVIEQNAPTGLAHLYAPAMMTTPIDAADIADRILALIARWTADEPEER